MSSVAAYWLCALAAHVSPVSARGASVALWNVGTHLALGTAQKHYTVVSSVGSVHGRCAAGVFADIARHLLTKIHIK